MKKTKSEKNKPEFASIADKKILCWTGIFILLMIVASLIMSERKKIDASIYHNAYSTNSKYIELEEQVEMLRFCMNRDIDSCEKDDVAEWNELHEDDRFVFASSAEKSKWATDINTPR